MNPSTRSAAKALLRGVAWFFFVVAGLAFLLGGAVISPAGGDGIPAEMEGIILALLFAGLGAIAKVAEDHLDEGDGPILLGENLRK